MTFKKEKRNLKFLELFNLTHQSCLSLFYIANLILLPYQPYARVIKSLNDLVVFIIHLSVFFYACLVL